MRAPIAPAGKCLRGGGRDIGGAMTSHTSTPTDLIPLKEACAILGKSPDTLRRWHKDKGITWRRELGNPSAPVLVSKAEVLRIAAEVAGVSYPVVQPVVHAGGVATRGAGDAALTGAAVTSAMQAHLATLEGVVSDTRRERDALRAELDAARLELAGVRAQLAERDARIVALERQLNGGARGLLGRIVKRAGII